MNSNIKDEILLRINKIDNPAMLSELNLFLSEWENSSNEVSNTELDKSIKQALLESESGLGIRHEEVWNKLKSA